MRLTLTCSREALIFVSLLTTNKCIYELAMIKYVYVFCVKYETPAVDSNFLVCLNNVSCTDPSDSHASEGFSNNSAYQCAENWLKKSLDIRQPGCPINKLARQAI